jgi:RHS repeat-associated protein
VEGVRRHDYLPFGEENVYNAAGGSRTAANGYVADGVRQKFTGHERDNETGLDFFGARYFSSIQGRFTSPDEFTGRPVELFTVTASANPTFYSDLTYPQSLNKYQYCYNNPLRYIDSDGHEPEDLDPQSGRKKKEEEEKIQIKTADTPKILDVKVKLIDPVKGEVPIGGEFEIKYKYAINDPSTVQDAQKPEDYGSIQPITPTGTFTDVNNVGLVGAPKVVVNQKKETVEVEKTERYVAQGAACGGTTCGINFKVVVRDPVNTNKVVQVRSKHFPSIGDKSPQTISVRNIPKPEKKK